MLVEKRIGSNTLESATQIDGRDPLPCAGLSRPDLRRRRTWLILSAALFALVAGLRLWLARHGSLPGDGLAERIIRQYGVHTQPLAAIAGFFGEVASATGATATVLVGTCVIYRRDGPRAASGMLLGAGVVALNAFLKHWWGVTPKFASVFPGAPPDYPSGHTAYVTAVLGYVAVLGRQHRQPEVMVVSLVLIVGMGFARVASGAHFVSDVVGGYLLGAGWLILVVLWGRPFAEPHRQGSDRKPDQPSTIGSNVRSHR